MLLPHDYYYFTGEGKHFFDERGMHLFKRDEVNYPTKVYCKALLYEMFHYRNSDFFFRTSSGTRKDIKTEIVYYPNEIFSYSIGASVFKCLREWAVKNGLPPEENDEEYSGQWWIWICDVHIDMDWIAERLKKEARRYYHQRKERFEEIMNDGMELKTLDGPPDSLLRPGFYELYEDPGMEEETG